MRLLRPWLVFLALACWCACNDSGEEADIPYGFACNPEATVSDLDNDGYKAPNDCDDSDPAVYPGAQELCNLIDDNCNGKIDEYTSRIEPYTVFGQRGDVPARVPYTSGGQARDPEDFPAQYAGDDEAAGLLMADIDLDEICDVVLQSTKERWVASYTIDCEDGFIREELFEAEAGFRLRGAGDIEGDGDVDLVTFDLERNWGHIWSNEGDGTFNRRSETVDWSVLGSITTDGRLADSQVLLDVDGDGMGDWVMCYAQYGKTYCFAAHGQTDGLIGAPTLLVNLDDVEASSITLGEFDEDEGVDAVVGLLETSDPGDLIPELDVYLLPGLPEGGLDDDPQILFDLGWQSQQAALGFDADWMGDGWLRTVDLDVTDEDHSELMIFVEVQHGVDVGLSVLFVPEPLAVNLDEGFQDGEIRPVVREVLPTTSSLPADVYSVVAAARIVE